MRHLTRCIPIVALTLASGIASAQMMGRLSGTVVDPDGEPIEGVTITITTPQMDSYREVKTTDRKGRFGVAHPDASFQYVYVFEKEGFLTLELPVRVATGGTMRQEFTLLPEGSGQPASAAEGEAAPTAEVPRVVKVYNEGVEAQQQGNLALAAERYAEAAEIAPDLAAPHSALAAVAFLQEDWAASAAHAEAALERDPNDVRALQLRYDAYRRLGNDEMAEEAEEALRELGDVGEVAKLVYNEAVDAYNAGDLTTAQAKLQQAVDLDPALIPAYTALARIALEQGSPSLAAEAAAAATEQAPDNGEAWILLFDAARLSGDEPTAAAALDRIAELRPDWIGTVLFDHATALYNDGKIEQAAEELERVVNAQPELARARYLYGMSLFNLGRTDEAKVELEKFIELAPDDPEAAIAEEMIGYMD